MLTVELFESELIIQHHLFTCVLTHFCFLIRRGGMTKNGKRRNWMSNSNEHLRRREMGWLSECRDDPLSRNEPSAYVNQTGEKKKNWLDSKELIRSSNVGCWYLVSLACIVNWLNHVWESRETWWPKGDVWTMIELSSISSEQRESGTGTTSSSETHRCQGEWIQPERCGTNNGKDLRLGLTGALSSSIKNTSKWCGLARPSGRARGLTIVNRRFSC